MVLLLLLLPLLLLPLLLLPLLLLLTSPSGLEAEEFTSADFRILDPVISVPGGLSTSGDYRLLQTLSEPGLGTSTASGFGLNPGFLYFPEVTRPTLTATPGDGQVSLSWTAAQGFLGWRVGSYAVGQARASGGPYSFSPVGNVLESTVVGLENGTTYFFVVRVNDALQNPIATSSEVSATPAAAPTAPRGGGGFLLRFLRVVVPRVIVPPPPPPLVLVPCEPPADLNCDGRVNLSDFSIFLALSGKPAPNQADFDQDQEVGNRDLSVLLAAWTERLPIFAPEKPPTRLAQKEPTLFERLREFGRAAVGALPSAQEEIRVEGEAARPPGFFERLGQFVSNLFQKLTAFFKKMILKI